MPELPLPLRRMVERSSIAVTVADATLPDHPMVAVNHAFTRLTGYTADEALGRNCRFLQGPGTDPEVRARLGRALAEARPVLAIVQNYTRDGLPFDNLLIVRSIVDGDRRPRFLVGCQYRQAQSADSRALAAHLGDEDALYCAFQSSMAEARAVVDRSQRLGAALLFARTSLHLKRAGAGQAILRVGGEAAHV